MRRVIAPVVAVLIATSLAAPAVAQGDGRRVSKEYTMANGMVVTHGGYGLEAHWTIGTAYHVFRPKAGERSVSFSIVDESGAAARAHIHIDADGDGELDEVDDFCRETPQPIRLGSAEKVEIGVVFGTCPDATPSIVTQGTITAEFSR